MYFSPWNPLALPPPPGWWDDAGYAEKGGSTVDDVGVGCGGSAFCCRSIFSRKNRALIEFPEGFLQQIFVWHLDIDKGCSFASTMLMVNDQSTTE